MPVPDARHAVRRELLRDSAYAVLRDAIVDGTLTPGEQLHDDELCRWLGLSRTPIREALTRLADDSLVESLPQRYTRVTRLDPGDARHVFPLLAVLHAFATEVAVPRFRERDHGALRAAQKAYLRALRAGDVVETLDADDRFHQIFVSRAGNPRMERVLEHLRPLTHRMERLAVGQVPARTAIAQHHAIIERTTAGNATGAASAARANWLTLGDLVEQRLHQIADDGTATGPSAIDIVRRTDL